MKTNSTTYVLLAVVLGIWGYFIFSLISDLNGESDLEILPVDSTQATIIATSNQEEFRLIPAVRDPFLNKILIEKPNPPKAKKSTVKVIDWPQVIYQGQLSSSRKNVRYVLSINGREHLFKLGQTIEEVKLVKAGKKKITARYKGETKSIALQ